MYKLFRRFKKRVMPGFIAGILVFSCATCCLFTKALVDGGLPTPTWETRAPNPDPPKPVRTPEPKRRSTQVPASWLCPSAGPSWLHYTGVVAAFVGSVDSIEYHAPNSIVAQQILPDRRVCYADLGAVKQHTSTGTFVMVFHEPS